MNMDLPFYLYLCTSILTLFGAMLFTANWIRIGEASRVYRYMTYFFFAMSYRHLIDMYTRYLWNTNMEEAINFHFSLLLTTRDIPIIIALVFLVGRMTYRFFFKRKRLTIEYQNKYAGTERRGKDSD